MTVQSPVWFITGCSSGFGWELSQAVLKRGWRLVATARDPAKLSGLLTDHSDQVLITGLDVTKPAMIQTAIAQAIDRFGRIDVLVNNAGSGYAASIEEGEDAAIRKVFESNVFGLAELIRQTLPIMRSQRCGHIVNFSSIGGIVGNPGSGYYAATKFAVEGLSDALAKEVEPLGIKVLLVEPGPFETGFFAAMGGGESRIDDYAATAGVRIKAISSTTDARPGDPQRAALAIISAVTAKSPPQRLLLGRSALLRAREKIAAMAADFNAWETTTLEADYPQFRNPN